MTVVKVNNRAKCVPFVVEAGQPIELDLKFHRFQTNFTSTGRYQMNRVQYYSNLDRAMKALHYHGGGFVIDLSTGMKYETVQPAPRKALRLLKKERPSQVRPWKSLLPGRLKKPVDAEPVTIQ